MSYADTIKRFYATMHAGQLGQDVDLAAFFTEDAAWHLPRSSPIYGELNGREAVVAMFEGSVEAYYQPGSMRFDYRTAVEQGEYLALQFTMSAKTPIGEHYENDYFILFRFRDGRISEAREFFDTAHLFAMVNPDKESL